MTPVGQQPSRQGSGRIEGLDLLRMAAALSVFGYHTLFVGPLQHYWPSRMLRQPFYFGDFGVDLFFVISGFVITLSSEGNSPWQFARSRALRLVPAFWVCSIITLLFDCSIPMVVPRERFAAWLVSQTFFPQQLGFDYLTSVYWTLSIEITFYVWVGVLIACGIWSTQRLRIAGAWLALAVVNDWFVGGAVQHWIATAFATAFAGHFVAGMLLYEIRRRRALLPAELLMLGVCWILVLQSASGHNSWITSLKDLGDHGVSDVALLFVGPVIVALVWWTAHVESVPLSRRTVMTLGAMSYPFYLLHADFSFWSHVIFERNWHGLGTYTDRVTYKGMWTLALAGSLLLSFLVVRWLEPFVRTQLKRVLDRLELAVVALRGRRRVAALDADRRTP